MESRKTIAIEKHNLGYNCAQSVALTYADLVDIAPEQLFKITEGFGLGGGREQTQKEVADQLGISQSYISRLEKRIISRLKKEILRLS